MAVYEYKALNRKGSQVSGIIDADTPADARVRLRRQGLFPTAIARSEDKIGIQSDVNVSRLLGRVKATDVAVFTRQLSTLLGAGMPLVPSLTALIEQFEGNPLKRVVIRLRDQVNGGTTFADALSQHPKIFSALYSNMVGAGETAGALESVLERLAELTEKNLKLRSRVRGAMLYPVVVMAVGVLVVVFLLIKVVPTIQVLFEDSQRALPLPTTVLLGISAAIREYWWAGALVLGGIYALFRTWKKSKRGRYLVDRWKLRMPIFGPIVRKMTVVRFARTLAIMISSGTPLLASFDIVKGIVNNEAVGEAVEEAKEAVRAGRSIADPFRRSRVFPPIVVHMIAVGESSASLEDMLFKMADSFEDEVEASVSVLTTVLEPLMILVMGVVVAFIVISILLPILQMSEIM